MIMANLKFSNRAHNDVTILCPEGKITLGDGDQELGEAVRGLLEGGSRKVLINFEKVNYLDSSGVGELVGCYTSAKSRGGELRICGMNPRIFNLIKMTSLHSVFTVKDTEEEALVGF
jgi:anti-sigma B factor antagonist